MQITFDCDEIEALGKGLRIMESFCDEHPRLTATEAAELAGISRAAARRYLLTLGRCGYAESDGRHFWLAPRVLRFGQGYLAGARMPKLVQPFLERLSAATGESANMSVLDGHEIVFLASSRSPRLLSVGHGAGARVPGHVVAAGYAVMATRGDDEVDDWCSSHEFCVFTPYTVNGPQEFHRRVDAVRRTGYAYNEQQHHMGVNGLSVSLHDRRGQCVGAIGLALPATGSTHERAAGHLLPQLVETREALRRIL
jgi:IclR family pca regulon transcriptional regulator